MQFHVSDLKSFSDCRLKWSFSSHMRFGRAPMVVSRPLRLGTFVHKCLERYYDQPWKDISQCFEEAMTALEEPEPPEGAYGIFENYLLWAQEHDNFEVLAVEQDFVVPLFGEHQFAGRWDLIVLYDDKVWINDFKITGMQFAQYGQYLADQDEQARAYCWAGKQVYGDDFGGIMFTLVRSKAPEKPLVLLNGALSRNKSQKTSWELYRRELRKRGEQTWEYAEMQQLFSSNPFVYRTQIILGDRPLEAFERRVVKTAKMMLDEDVLIYPNANPISCRMCAYQMPCSVYHAIDAETAQRILFDEYAPSKYILDAQDVHKEDTIEAHLG